MRDPKLDISDEQANKQNEFSEMTLGGEAWAANPDNLSSIPGEFKENQKRKTINF